MMESFEDKNKAQDIDDISDHSSQRDEASAKKKTKSKGKKKKKKGKVAEAGSDSD